MGKLVGNYLCHDRRTSTGATETFIGYEVPRGKTAILTFMSIIDYTNYNFKLILGIRDASGVDHYIKVLQGSYSGQTDYQKIHSLWMEGEILLLPGQRPLGIIESATKGDVCYFTAHGGLYEEAAPLA
jgi:hypothetical protein